MKKFIFFISIFMQFSTFITELMYGNDIFILFSFEYV